MKFCLFNSKEIIHRYSLDLQKIISKYTQYQSEIEIFKKYLELLTKDITIIDNKIVKYYRYYDVEYDPIESYYLKFRNLKEYFNHINPDFTNQITTKEVNIPEKFKIFFTNGNEIFYNEMSEVLLDMLYETYTKCISSLQ